MIARLEATVAEAEAAVTAASADADAAAQAVAAQRGDDQKARDALQRAETALASKAAEEKALAGVLAADAGKGVRPVVDDLDVEPGWEAALGRWQRTSARPDRSCGASARWASSATPRPLPRSRPGCGQDSASSPATAACGAGTA